MPVCHSFPVAYRIIDCISSMCVCVCAIRIHVGGTADYVETAFAYETFSRLLVFRQFAILC